MMGVSTGAIGISTISQTIHFGSLQSTIRSHNGSPDSRSIYRGFSPVLSNYSRSGTPELYLRHDEINGTVGDIPPPSGATRRIVTGPPSKDHWKPDFYATECALCRNTFNVVNRRHHCRKCGEIFCSNCSAYSVRLDQMADFHPAGVKSRVCKTCYDEFQSRVIPLKASREEDQFENDLEVPPDDSMTFKGVENGKASIAVPENWHWSTF
ncbi:hypothetical protein HK098_000790 [Nowakowskiella sp. JEL0407]|nr:hypothetical protein HK098_000790 [Nowakowskiella sp. JEL0407]